MDVLNYAKAILDEIYSSTVEYANNFSRLDVLDTYKDYYADLIQKLDAYIQYLNVHRKYLSEDVKLTTIDVHQYINSFFTRSQQKKGKHINYLIQRGLIGESEPVKLTDPILTTDFKIDNVLPIMNIVLFQIADNALKYMPKDTPFTIELRITEDQYRFRFKNLGPSISKSELNSILESNIRGHNAALSNSGQGIGLYIANQIVTLHKWINASLSIDSKRISLNDSDKQLLINGVPQSEFIATLQFDRHISGDYKNDGNYEWIERDFIVILIHNLYQVMTHLIELYSRIDTIQVKNRDYSWRKTNNFYRTDLNLFLDKINLCNLLYRGFDNQYALEQVSRINNQFVPMRIQSIFHHTLDYINKRINQDIAITENGTLLNRSFSSGLWTFVAGFIDFLFELIPSSCQELFVEYLSSDDNRGFFVTFDFNNVNTNQIQSLIQDDQFKKSRFRMYQLMIDLWDGEITFSEQSISIYLPYQEAL